VVIRTATSGEAETLARFAERTFRAAFAADNRLEDMDAYCAAAFAPEVMRSYLADPSITSLVMVTADGELAAYAQLRPEGPDDGTELPEPLELWRFYVDQPHHGRGTAQRMMDAVVDAARARRGHAVAGRLGAQHACASLLSQVRVRGHRHTHIRTRCRRSNRPSDDPYPAPRRWWRVNYVRLTRSRLW
jgi:GNAT superfamily N-acetyltransferase